MNTTPTKNTSSSKLSALFNAVGPMTRLPTSGPMTRLPSGPMTPFTPVTRTFPGSSETYQSPVVAQPTAPVAPTPAPRSSTTAPALDYSKYTNPKTGQVYTPQEYADSLAQRVGAGSIPTYAGNALTQGPQTSAQLKSTGTDLNNQRNDIAVGETDPYKVGNKSGVAYSPTELAAIEKAYAGIYDPALKDVFAKLDTKEKQDAADLAQKNKLAEMAQQHKYDLETEQLKINANDVNSSPNQDKLEQQYRQILLKPLSNRSGGLGLEDAKVNQAIHLKSLISQYKDANGNYNIPATQYNELALGLARLISPTGTVGSEVQNSVTQATGQGDINKALTYVTGTPFNGSSQAVYKNLIDTIDRQGLTAQQNRDQYMTYLQGLVPTSLDPRRSAALEKNLLNIYQPIVSNESSGFTVTDPDGGVHSFPTQEAANAFKKAIGQ